MKHVYSIALFFAISLSAYSQSIPFPSGAANYNEISPWGHTNAGTSWNTSNFIPFIYQGAWFRLMPPQGVTANITYNANGTINTVTWNYSDPTKKYPMILFFQGAGEVGTDNNKQLLHGGERHKNAVLSNEFPGFLIYPQSTYIDKAKNLVDKLIQVMPIDMNRIYVHGLSNGAVWTWEFAEAYPTTVAAMAPMSGVTDQLPSLLYTPIRLAQGGLDKNPNPGYAQQIVDYYNNNGGQLEYFYFPTLGHSTWNTMYNRSDFFSWFLQFKKNTIQVRFDKTEYCPGDPVNTTMGFTPGFEAYEWRKDGVLISGATSNSITVTQRGLYTGRIRNRGVWSDWSEAIDIKDKATTQTPAITLATLKSTVIPDINGTSDLTLTLPDGYASYSYRKDGVVIGNTQSIVVNTTGTYTAVVQETGGCSTNPSVPFIVSNAAGTPKPDPISNLQTTTLSKTSIRLNWDQTPSPAVNETGFEIYRGVVAGGPYNLVNVTAPNVITFTDNNLLSNTTYYYKIRPIAATGAAATSAEVSGVTDVDLTPPTAPNNLQVTAFSQTSVSLSWSASTDNVGVTGYDVYVRPYGATNFIKANTTTNLNQVVSGLSTSTLYSFVVRAKDQAANNSPASNQVNQATYLVGLNYANYLGSWTALPNFSALSPVGIGTVTTFTLNPTPQGDNFGKTWTGWLQVPTSGSYVFFTTSDAGSKLWVNNVQVVDNDGVHTSRERSGTISLNAGYYPIRAEYFETTGSESFSVSWDGPGFSKQTIPAGNLRENFVAPAAPSTPSNLTSTTLSYQSIRINWNTYTGTGTEIEIFRSLNNSSWSIINTIPKTENSYTDTGLNPNTRYYYRIRAVHSGAVGSYTSSTNKVTSALPPLPATPTNLTIAGFGVNSVQLNWTDASNNEENFEVFRSVGDNTNYTKLVTLPAATTAYTDNAAFAHTLYYYRVQSKNVTGSSGNSNAVNVTTLNTAPVIEPIADVTMRFDDEITLEVHADDADNDFLVFAGTPASLPPFVQVFDYGEGVAYVTITPTEAQQGNYENVEITVQDSFGGSHAVQFDININDNHSPVVAPIAPRTLKETNTLQFAVTGSDADAGQAITWSMENAPSFVTLTPSGNTANINVVPGVNDAGVYNITIKATDPLAAFGSQVLVLTVEDYNPNFFVNINFRTSATANGPAGWNNVGNENNNTPIPTTALNKSDGTSSGFTISGTGNWDRWKDNSGFIPGVYPNAVQGSFLAGWGGNKTMTISGLNPQGKYNFSILSSAVAGYESWANVNSTFIINSETRTINARGNANTLAVFTDVSPTAGGTVVITMQPFNTSVGIIPLNAIVIESYFIGNTPPPAPSNVEVSVTQAQAIQVNWVDNSDNEQSQEVERSTNGVDFTSVGTVASNLTSFTDTNFAAGVTYHYRVRAVNQIGASAWSNIDYVLAPNRTPVILPVSALSVAENDMKWVEVNATDADNDEITFSLQNEPPFMWIESIDENSASLVFSPSVGEQGTYNFQLHADDIHGARSTANLSVTVYNYADVEFKINFTAGDMAVSPWNNITNSAAGASLTNIKNSNNVTTGVSMTVVNAWGGANTNGHNTGNNSGIYPDAVMSSSWFVQDNVARNLQFAGLNPAKTYDFTFFASRMGVPDVRNTIYSSGAKSAILNASGNTSNTAKVVGLKPNASGQLTITVTKETPAAFGYLGSMVIREYEAIVVPTVPNAPISLISQVLSRTSIRLNWVDASSDETGFQIWRSVGNNTSYTLLTTVGAGVTTFTNSSLAQSTQYFYKVAAVNAVGPSPYSNETTASTFDYSVSLNPNNFLGNPTNWNSFAPILSNGTVVNNLIDDAGANTGISMTVVKFFTGENQFGMNTGNNSGIVPDAVMQGAWYLDPQQTATLRFGNLSFLKKYNFSFFGSRNGGGDRTTTYTINGNTVMLDASFNTSNMVQIKDVVPDIDGTITINFGTTLTASFGYLNAMIIQVVPNMGGARTATNEVAEETTEVFEKLDTEVIASPNPFTDRLSVRIGADLEDQLKVSLIDASGRVVIMSDYDRNRDGNEVHLDVKGELSSGLFILRVIGNNTGQAKNIRVIRR